MADARTFEVKATLATLNVVMKECIILDIMEMCRAC
jgi:hypothetical protein